MIDAVAKGQRREAACAAELKAAGWNVWATIRVKYRNIDLWQLFDVAAQDPKTGALLFIQVKSNRCDTETRDRIRAFKVPEGVRKEVWIHKDGKGWIKERYDNN